MKALILAAGEGQASYPLTDTRPKTMIPICGKPILEHTIELIKEIAINEFVVVRGHQGDKIKDYFNYGHSLGVNIQYANQKELNGIGDAILKARKYWANEESGEYFLLVYGDTIVNSNIYNNVMSLFHTIHKPIAASCLTAETHMYGNIFMGPKGNITRIEEKPHGAASGNYVLMGVFLLPVRFFDYLEEANADIEKAWKLLIEKDNLYTSIWEQSWVDVGYPWHILNANKILMKTWNKASIASSAVLEENVIFSGPIYIDENVIIKSGTVLRGPCYIGPDSFIGNNVLIREFTTLGKNSVVGYGVELKNTVILDNSKIGRLSFVGDSVIGENVEIGPGTMTVNKYQQGGTIKVKIGNNEIDTLLTKIGSFIGDNSLIGATHTLLPGTIIAPNTIIPNNNTLGKYIKE